MAQKLQQEQNWLFGGGSSTFKTKITCLLKPLSICLLIPASSLVYFRYLPWLGHFFLSVRNRTHSNSLKKNWRNLLGSYKAKALSPKGVGIHKILELQVGNHKEWKLLSPVLQNLMTSSCSSAYLSFSLFLKSDFLGFFENMTVLASVLTLLPCSFLKKRLTRNQSIQ